MIADTWIHRLSFALRFRNHFTGEAVPDELPVRLAASLVRPVLTSDGSTRRHSDGTYRFADIPAGRHSVFWTPPLTRTFRDWTAWNQTLQITLPQASPEVLIEQELWPVAAATVPANMTAVRGQVQGPNRANLEVRIAPPTQTTDRFSRTDEFGEFLYLLPGALPPDAQGMASLQIDVRSRTVVRGKFIPAGAGTAFTGAGFKVKPGVVSRIVYEIT